MLGQSRLEAGQRLTGLGGGARLWELFEELSSQLSTEAADDFQALFGKAFLEAYEAHIDALDKDPDTR